MFPVKDHGHGDFVRIDHVQHEPGFFPGFVGIQGLGEEINAQLDTGLGGTFQILTGEFVLHQLAGFVTTVAKTDDGKIHAGLRYLMPIDLALIGGNVDTG